MKLTSEKAWTISPDVRSTQSEDGAVLLDIKQGLCFSLNVVGAKVWEKLATSQTGTTLARLVSDLAPQFAVSVDQLTTDLEHYLGELEAKGLARTNGNPSSVGTSGRGKL
ncbi:MAG: PqqD family protein [Acidobacteria bacterium]|nr:PqqD family protein [Acidobacteriota bacterium]